MDLVAWAADESRRRLASLGSRWTHSSAVASRAQEIAAVVAPGDRGILVAAAYLHDIGYAPDLATYGFHPLDGGRWLQDQGFDRLAALVAHHTSAVVEAEALGLADAMGRFRDERSAVSDALTYSDLTTGPTGERMTVGGRLNEIEFRYGHESLVVRALEKASDGLSAAVERTEQRLSKRTGGGRQQRPLSWDVLGSKDVLEVSLDAVETSRLTQEALPGMAQNGCASDPGDASCAFRSIRLS